MHRLPQRLSQISAAVAIVAAPLAAHAQFAYSPAPLRDTSSSPYYIGVSQAFSHDSNIFRDPDGPLPQSDTISTTGVRLGIDQPISRQRIGADLAIRYNKYANNGQLDNTSYGLNLRGEFETVNNISGDIHYTRAQFQAPFEDNRSTTRLTTKNSETTDEFGLRVQYGLKARWIAEANGLYRSQTYSAAQYQYQEQNEGVLGANIRYQPSDRLSFGVGVRGTHGQLPNYVAVGGTSAGDSYNRQDLDFLSTWTLSGLTTLNGRISATHSTHNVATERNFTGVTGELGANYKPTGRMNLFANLSRETNDAAGQYTTTLGSSGGSTGSTPGSTSSPGTITRLQDTRVVNSLRLQAVYDLTAKIQLDTVARYVHRSLRDAVIVDALGNAVGTANGTDRTAGIAIGARYTISRAWSAACSVGRDRRSTDLTGSVVTYPYGVTTASCSAQLSLR